MILFGDVVKLSFATSPNEDRGVPKLNFLV